jgi:hypothetical protein
MIPGTAKLKEVTFGVSSKGNTQALVSCLLSVLNARVIPGTIQVRLEGDFPGMNNFYFEQVSELARWQEVNFHVAVARSQGVRASRDFHLNSCSTPFLWMGDDDVAYRWDCLSEYYRAYAYLRDQQPEIFSSLAYLAGSKPDLNNRRGYANFDTSINPESALQDGCSLNHVYDTRGDVYPRVVTIDTGNAFLNLQRIHEKEIRFSLFDDSLNSGGEDTLFGLQCYKAELTGLFVPRACGYHLEKPTVNFGEFAARGEMLLRACDLLEIDKAALRNSGFMPWLWESK